MAPNNIFKIEYEPTNTLVDNGKERFDTIESDINRLKERIENLEGYSNPTQYIFINKACYLNVGKAIAQASHAQEELFVDLLDNSTNEERDFFYKCMRQNPRTIIILETQDTEELYKINSYLESCGIRTGIYVDEIGENYSLEPTAMATTYVDKEDPRMKLIFSNFKLYRSNLEEFYYNRLDNIDYIVNHMSEGPFKTKKLVQKEIQTFNSSKS